MYRQITHCFWMALGMIVALTIGAQAQSRTPNLLDWQAIGGSGAIQSTKPFTLKNLTEKANLRFGTRTWGGEQGSPVRFSTPFALLNEVEHDAMIYGERPVGINLVWMKDFYKSTWDRIKGGIKGTAGLFADAFLGL